MGYKKKGKKCVRSLGNMEKRKRENEARGSRESAKRKHEIAQSNPLLFIRCK